jgi:hypothetical protein
MLGLATLTLATTLVFLAATIFKGIEVKRRG